MESTRKTDPPKKTPNSLSNQKEELRKLFEPTCKMLKINYNEMCNDIYYELSKTYNNEYIRKALIFEMYRVVSIKYKLTIQTIKSILNDGKSDKKTNQDV